MNTRINREFLARHLFVAFLMLGLGGWFGYDGFIRYPGTPARDLYASIEKSAPPEGFDLEAFKTQKTKSQLGFMALALLAAAAVGAHLAAVSRFRLEFDDKGFVFGGRRFSYADVERVDDSAWARKGICIVYAGGIRFKADAWHHAGVKDFHAMLEKAGKSAPAENKA